MSTVRIDAHQTRGTYRERARPEGVKPYVFLRKMTINYEYQ